MANSSSDDLDDLLQKFRRVPGNGKAIPKTFLEISEFPRSELAISNILAFFFNPNEEHGFTDLFLRSLVQQIAPDFPLGSIDLRRVKIIREDRTDNNKRIDIVIDAGTVIIGIENKVDADNSYNPYPDYHHRIVQRANGRPYRCILLSLSGECPGCAATQEFQPLTYDDLITSVQRNLGEVILSASPSFVTYLLDFIATLQNFKKGIRMDRQTLEFFKSNEASAVKFYLVAEALLKQIREKADAVKKNLKIPSGFQKPWIWSFYNEPDSSSFWDTVVCRAVLPGGLQISVDAAIELNKGWSIYIWNPPDGSKLKLLSERLAERRIVPKQPAQDGDWLWDQFDFTTSTETVTKSYQELISRIGNYLNEL